MFQPHTKTKFKLIIAGGGGQTAVEAEALNIGALESEMGVREIRNGSLVSTARNSETSKTTGRLRVDFHVGNPGWDNVVKWWDQVNDLSKPLEKRSIDLIILDDEDKEVQKIKLEKAWPVRFGILGASKEAESSAIIEFIEFIAEKFSVAAKGNSMDDSSSPPASKRGPLITVNNTNKFQVGENFNVGGVGANAFRGSQNSVLGGVQMGSPLAAMGAAAVGGVAQAVGKKVLGVDGGNVSGNSFASQNPPGQTSGNQTSNGAPPENHKPSEANSKSDASNVAQNDTASTSPHGDSLEKSPNPTQEPLSENGPTSSGLGAGPAIVAGTAGVAAVAGRFDKTEQPELPENGISKDGLTKPKLDSAVPTGETAKAISGNRDRADASQSSPSSNENESEKHKPRTKSSSQLDASDAVNIATAATIASSALRGLSGSIDDKAVSQSIQKNVETSESAANRPNEKFDKKKKVAPPHKKENAKKEAPPANESKRVYDLLGNGTLSTPPEVLRDSEVMSGGSLIFSDNISLKPGQKKATAKSIQIFVRNTGLPAPTIYIREEGGESIETLNAVREHLENGLRATILKDEWKSNYGGEYRYEGKKISVRREILGLGISTYDMPLRKQLVDNLSALLNAERVDR